MFVGPVTGSPTIPDPNTSAIVLHYKWEPYRDTNWCICSFQPRGGHALTKVSRESMGTPFKSIGVRARSDFPDFFSTRRSSDFFYMSVRVESVSVFQSGSPDMQVCIYDVDHFLLENRNQHTLIFILKTLHRHKRLARGTTHWWWWWWWWWWCQQEEDGRVFWAWVHDHHHYPLSNPTGATTLNVSSVAMHGARKCRSEPPARFFQGTTCEIRNSAIIFLS